MSLLLSLCAAGYQMAPPPHFATNRRPYASRVTPIMDVSLSDHEALRLPLQDDTQGAAGLGRGQRHYDDLARESD